MCAGEIQCVYIQKRRYLKMTAFATAKSGYCTYFAAASTSARIRNSMDTVILAVSIVVIPLIAALRT